MYNKSITKPILLGLVMLAVSVAMASGRKPVEQIYATMRLISAQEISEILTKCPDLIYEGTRNLVFNKGDTKSLKGIYPFSKVEDIILLNNLFPNNSFYKGLMMRRSPPYPYLIAVGNKNQCKIPSQFNQLLLDNNIEISDDNIIELAKAFVILAVGGEQVTEHEIKHVKQELLSFPQITFLEGKRIKEYDRRRSVMMDVQIKCRIGDREVQTWKFTQSRDTPRKGEWVKVGQFSGATVFINDKPIRHFQIKRATKETGRVKLINPQIEIATDVGNATVEQDSFYYLITYRNGELTNNSMRFRLFNFESNEKDVYIKIAPIEGYTYGPYDTIGPVQIGENGEGHIDWTPTSEIYTGICFVCAGNIPPEDSFYKRTEQDKSLTLEKVITGRFHNDYPDTFTVYYTDQFFHDLNQGSNYPSQFADCIKNAAIESWQKQVRIFYRILDVADKFNQTVLSDRFNIDNNICNDNINWS